MSELFSERLSSIKSKSGSTNQSNLEKDLDLYVERCTDFLRMRTQAIEIGDDENPTELIPPCPIKFWVSQVSYKKSKIKLQVGDIKMCRGLWTIKTLSLNYSIYYGKIPKINK